MLNNFRMKVQFTRCLKLSKSTSLHYAKKYFLEKVTNGKSSNITFKLVSHIIIDELGWELFSGTLTIQDSALYFFQVTTRQSKVIKTVARNKILVT